ncbi:MAG: type II toxin-antitoxin system RatA family toxin [Pseudomonadales bacterium]|nr:type II toxin-antitoxin system RatA family toxin [Pseudomonadales bacterium]
MLCIATIDGIRYVGESGNQAGGQTLAAWGTPVTVIEQSALLPYSDQAMFDLVNDIESYPLFMDGCLGAEIISRSADKVTARLDLGKAGVTHSFSTCNYLHPPHAMEMELVNGPFQKFQARWTFKALGPAACKASLYMEFEFSMGFIDAALKKIFTASGRNLVNAVCKRAELIYGK